MYKTKPTDQTNKKLWEANQQLLIIRNELGNIKRYCKATNINCIKVKYEAENINYVCVYTCVFCISIWIHMYLIINIIMYFLSV